MTNHFFFLFKKRKCLFNFFSITLFLLDNPKKRQIYLLIWRKVKTLEHSAFQERKKKMKEMSLTIVDILTDVWSLELSDELV